MPKIFYIHPFIRQWLYRPLLGPGIFLSLVIFFTQTIEFLGWGISQSQGCYLHTGQYKYRIKAHNTDIHASSGISYLSNQIINNSVFWDITPCSSMKVDRRFVRTCRLLQIGFLFALLHCPWRWIPYVLPKRWLIFSEIHDVIYQKTELFITTGGRTTNPRTDKSDCGLLGCDAV
jgi:hypothetical protein